VEWAFCLPLPKLTSNLLRKAEYSPKIRTLDRVTDLDVRQNSNGSGRGRCSTHTGRRSRRSNNTHFGSIDVAVAVVTVCLVTIVNISGRKVFRWRRWSGLCNLLNIWD
jgi:hypothetical protein